GTEGKAAKAANPGGIGLAALLGRARRRPTGPVPPRIGGRRRARAANVDAYPGLAHTLGLRVPWAERQGTMIIELAQLQIKPGQGRDGSKAGYGGSLGSEPA